MNSISLINSEVYPIVITLVILLVLAIVAVVRFRTHEF
jgi:hypothetical protein